MEEYQYIIYNTWRVSMKDNYAYHFGLRDGNGRGGEGRAILVSVLEGPDTFLPHPRYGNPCPPLAGHNFLPFLSPFWPFVIPIPFA